MSLVKLTHFARWPLPPYPQLPLLRVIQVQVAGSFHCSAYASNRLAESLLAKLRIFRHLLLKSAGGSLGGRSVFVKCVGENTIA